MSAWENPHRIVTAEPLQTDHVVVTLIDGRRASVQPAHQYERVRDAAQNVAKETGCRVKVLPMIITELMNFMGVDAAAFAASLTDEEEAGLRQATVTACKEALREANDAAVRKEAYDLLVRVGELRP